MSKPPKNAADPTAPHLLTAASVALLPTTGAQYRVRDSGKGALTGFAVQVSAGGKKTFTLDFRVRGDRRTARMTFGSSPMVPVALARREAQTAKSIAMMGRNPAAERVAATDKRRADRRAKQLELEQRQADEKRKRLLTVERITRDYIRARRGALKQSTLSLYESTISCYLTGQFGQEPLPSVTPLAASTLLRDVCENKIPAGVTRTSTNGRTVGGTGAARTLRRLLSSVWRYAMEERQIVSGVSPIPTAKKAKLVDETKERFLTPQECSRLMDCLILAETVGIAAAPSRRRKYVEGDTSKHRPKLGVDTPFKADPIAVAALRFLLLTGWRKEEALSLTWGMIRTDLGLIALPDTKTGESFRAVSAAATECLDSLPRSTDQDWCFPSSRSATGHLQSVTRLWLAVRHHTKLNGTRLHDLRHTAASLAINNGASLTQVQAMLGQKSARSTERYAKLIPMTGLYAAECVSSALAAATASKP